MFCQNCGTQINDGTAFCPNCGSALGVENKPAQETVNQYQTEQQAEGAFEQPVQNNAQYQQQPPVQQAPVQQANGAQNFFQELLENYKLIWTGYANAKGRISRRKFWMTILANFIVVLGLGIITSIIPFLGFVSALYPFAVIVPIVCLAIRRIHDIGHNGSRLCFYFIPFAGPILVIIDLVKEGMPQANQFGPVPSER